MRALLSALALIGVAGVVRADRAAEEPAKLTAVAWLNAPRKTPPALDDAIAMTELPFWYAGVGASGSSGCDATGTVADKAELARVLDCLRARTGPLLDRATTWSMLTSTTLPAPLRPLRARIAELGKTHALVLAHRKVDHDEDFGVLAVSYDPAAKATCVAALVTAHQHR